jgi:hypothetical protein
MTEPLSHIHENARESKITLTTDTRLAIQFPTKQAARNAAKDIGWQAKDATPIEIMGFKLWSIWDDHCRYLTRTGYAYAAHLRGINTGWTPPAITSQDIARALAE